MPKKTSFCPFSKDGCKTETQVCTFWGERKGCEIESALAALKSLPNLLRRLELQLEEGKHIQGVT